MKDIVKKFQTVRLAFQSQERFVRDACFLTWKQYFERRRRLRQIALIRSMRYRWNRWRDYGRNRQQREMEDFAQTLDDKIQRLTELSALFEKTGGSPLVSQLAYKTWPVDKTLTLFLSINSCKLRRFPVILSICSCLLLRCSCPRRSPASPGPLRRTPQPATTLPR